jgi:hydroxymethylbilane synthase
MLASKKPHPVTKQVPKHLPCADLFLMPAVLISTTPTALPITIATRESRLALWQAEHVKALLEGLGHRVSLLGMTTLGDQILDRSLSKVGGKGLFVKELEVALQEGRADIAVHSLKDVPMDLPEGFALACVMEREDPRDAWVSPHCASLAELPSNAIVGTSSLRRLVLLREALDALGRQDVRIEPLRGNLDTRLRKLDEGQYHAIILAAAGLKRLGLGERIRHIFEPVESLPAAGQGALGIEVRADRSDLVAALAPLVHLPTWLRVAAERTVSRAMGGSCSMPLAAYAHWDAAQQQLQLDAAWGDPDGRQGVVRVSDRQVVRDLAQAEALGQRVADALRGAGAQPPVQA